MLFLVEFTVIGVWQLHSKTIDRTAYRLNHSRVVPMNQLWSDDARVRSVQLFDQTRNRSGRKHDVIVQETEKPAVSLYEVQHCITRTGVPRISPQEADHRLRQSGLNGVENET